MKLKWLTWCCLAVTLLTAGRIAYTAGVWFILLYFIRCQEQCWVFFILDDFAFFIPGYSQICTVSSVTGESSNFAVECQSRFRSLFWDRNMWLFPTTDYCRNIQTYYELWMNICPLTININFLFSIINLCSFSIKNSVSIFAGVLQINPFKF